MTCTRSNVESLALNDLITRRITELVTPTQSTKSALGRRRGSLLSELTSENVLGTMLSSRKKTPRVTRRAFLNTVREILESGFKPNNPEQDRWNIEVESCFRVLQPEDLKDELQGFSYYPPPPCHTSKWSPNTTKSCELCSTRFTFLIRRHHCRICGIIICAKCSIVGWSREITKLCRCCDQKVVKVRAIQQLKSLAVTKLRFEQMPVPPYLYTNPCIKKKFAVNVENIAKEKGLPIMARSPKTATNELCNEIPWIHIITSNYTQHHSTANSEFAARDSILSNILPRIQTDDDESFESAVTFTVDP